MQCSRMPVGRCPSQGRYKEGVALKRKFHERTYLFSLKGVSIFGNAENGAIIGIDWDGKKVIEQIMENGWPEEAGSDSDSLMDCLNQMGYLHGRTASLENVYLHVTDRCNLSCVGCYSFVEHRNCRTDLPVETIRSIVDQIAECGKPGIVISGGEPFLRKDLKDILQHIRSRKLETAVITNGTSDRERVRECLPYIDVLNVSVDGFDRKTRFIRNEGIMDSVLEFVEYFRKRIPMNLIFTLHKKNVPYMREYIRLAESLQVSFNFSIFTVAPDHPEWKDYMLGQEELAQIADVINEEDDIYIADSAIRGQSDGLEGLSCRDGCGLGCRMISIAADGKVYPCHMLHDPAVCMGDLLETPLKTIWTEQAAVWEGLRVNSTESCRECEYRYLCGGGCQGRAFLYRGQFHKRDPFCLLTKKYLDQRTEILKKYVEPDPHTRHGDV